MAKVRTVWYGCVVTVTITAFSALKLSATSMCRTSAMTCISSCI